MTSKQIDKRKNQSFLDLLDYWILVPVVLLTLIGLYVLRIVLMNGYGYDAYPANFIKQFAAALMGLFVALAICLLEETTLKLLGNVLYVVSILLLIYVKIDGYSLADITGADSWLELPVIGSFQPSELAKLGIAMVTANVLADIKLEKRSLVSGMATVAGLFALPFFMIMTEPDFGSAMVILIMMLVVLFVWGVGWKIIFGVGLAGIISLPLMWFFFFSDYQRGRILTFLFPGHDVTDSYHINQALHAIASGGLTGNKTGVDIPVPVKESDFIFTAIAENLGFIGVFTVLVLVLILIGRCLWLAYQISDRDYAVSYYIVAMVAVLAFHFVENMGMNVGILPITGIPLPFISNGGTSMIVNYLAIGMILNASMNYKSYAGD